MSNKPEDLSDLLEPIEPVKAKQTPVATPTPKKTAVQHRHPRAEEGHIVMYSRECAACVAADEARRTAKEPPIPAEDLARTVFLVPNFGPDQEICLNYLKRRYNDTAKHVTHTVKWPTLIGLPHYQLVLVRRVPKPDEKLSTHFKEVPTEIEGRKKLVQLRPNEFYGEVLESAPVQVGDHAVQAMFSLNVQSDPNVTPLITALQDVAGPELRILLHNPPDVTFCFTQP